MKDKINDFTASKAKSAFIYDFFIDYFFYLSPKTRFTRDCDTDKMILNNKAVKNVSTSKPPTILSHNIIINPLMTNKNNPSVRKVIGKVNNTKIGFTKILSNPKTIATKSAVVKLATCTPVIKCEINRTKIAVTKTLTINFICVCIYCFKNTIILNNRRNFNSQMRN